MNISQHFESYRASLRSSAIDGFVEYAKAVATADPVRFPVVHDYLMHAFSETGKAVRENDENLYKVWLSHHQEAMVALFERMVEDEMWDYRSTSPVDLLNLIKQSGWPMFKFSKIGLEMDLETDGQFLTLALIPRYTPRLSNIWRNPKKVCFDADELKMLQDSELSPMVTLKTVAQDKLRNPGMKLVDAASFPEPTYRHPERINTQEKVVDWSAPLF